MVGNRKQDNMIFLRLSKKVEALENRIIELERIKEENNKKPAKKEVSKDDIVKKLK